MKFRVWHKEFQRFLGGDEWVINFNGGLNFFDLFSGLVQVNKDKYVIQQYTGLKDENGRDIYEGDIVQYDLGNEKNIINKICWNHFSWRVVELDGEGCYPLAIGLNYKVIGNIFQNLELLKA